MKCDIVLYSTGCPRCEVIKGKLAEKPVFYKENNSVEDMTALGITQVPMLSINGKMYDFKSAVEWINNI